MNGIQSKRTEKLQIMLNDEELGAIDDWRFAFRKPSRAAAIRELITRGLNARETPEASGKKPGKISGVECHPDK